eukprot:sb/3474415/
MGRIILAQEPPIIGKSSKVRSSGGFTALYDKRAERPRASILINNNLGRNVFLLDKFTNRDTVSILIKLGTKSAILCSMYMDRELECPPKLLVLDRRVRFLLLDFDYYPTDTNAHNSSWGATVKDPIGKKRALRDELF